MVKIPKFLEAFWDFIHGDVVKFRHVLVSSGGEFSWLRWSQIFSAANPQILFQIAPPTLSFLLIYPQSKYNISSPLPRFVPHSMDLRRNSFEFPGERGFYVDRETEMCVCVC